MIMMMNVRCQYIFLYNFEHIGERIFRYFFTCIIMRDVKVRLNSFLNEEKEENL